MNPSVVIKGENANASRPGVVVLAQMEQQLQDMDSLEYIKEAASELGMVEKDTIVIKERE